MWGLGFKYKFFLEFENVVLEVSLCFWNVWVIYINGCNEYMERNLVFYSIVIMCI